MNKEVLIDYNLYFIEELAFILKVRGISDVYISTTKDMILFNSSYEFNKNFDIRPDKCITRKENYKPWLLLVLIKKKNKQIFLMDKNGEKSIL